MIKGGDDCAPCGRREYPWANNNIMTINLTKTKEMIVRGKSKGLNLAFGVYFVSDPTNWDRNLIIFFTKRVSACTSCESVRNMGIHWIACTISIFSIFSIA